jgi:hypothetical protein
VAHDGLQVVKMLSLVIGDVGDQFASASWCSTTLRPVLRTR